MKRRLILLFLVLAPLLSAFCQSHNFLDRTVSRIGQHGVSFSLQLYTDTLAGSRANAKTPSATAFQYFDVSMSVDLGRFSPRLAGTRAFASVHVNGSYAADFSGAYQTIAGIAGAPGVHFAELWFEQVFGNSVRLRLGKIDANPDFAFVESATGFLNAAFCYDPTFFMLPNYNSTNWGGEFLVRKGALRANFAAFLPSEGTGALLMEESGVEWRPADWKGRISVGAWQRTGRMPSFGGINEKGSQGVYFVGEQQFWRRQRYQGKQAQSLSGFVQVGGAPSEFSAFTRHLGVGVVWSAPLARRDQDAAGFAITRGRFTTDPAAGFDHAYETVFETYYRFQLLQQLSVSPDIQYAIHPGGVSTNHNTFAAGARMVFTLSRKSE